MVTEEQQSIFSKEIVLENERALLRPLEEDDYKHLLEYSLNEPDTWRFGAITAAGEDNLKNYINVALDAKMQRKEYPFIVYDKQARKYAGSTRFYDIQEQWQTTQLGYTWYGDAFRRSGLNRHCKLLLLTFAFEEWKMERVEFRADENNLASIAAMKSIGCTLEGTLRNNMPNLTGGRRTSVILSILKDEWFAGVKQRLIEITK